MANASWVQNTQINGFSSSSFLIGQSHGQQKLFSVASFAQNTRLKPSCVCVSAETTVVATAGPSNASPRKSNNLRANKFGELNADTISNKQSGIHYAKQSRQAPSNFQQITIRESRYSPFLPHSAGWIVFPSSSPDPETSWRIIFF